MDSFRSRKNFIIEFALIIIIALINRMISLAGL